MAIPARPNPKSGALPIWLTLRTNLFGSVTDSLVTLLVLLFLAVSVPPLFNWMFLKATFWAETGEACRDTGGACWAFISSRWGQIIYGYYPPAEWWRANVVGLLGFASLVPFLKLDAKKPAWLLVWFFLVYPVFSWFLLRGDFWGLVAVDTNEWGGILLTLLVSSVGITLSLPLGILLALGRRSKLPIIRSASVVFIEFWRGVPLITVLFMSSFMLPLFFPREMQFDKLLRVLTGVTLFSAAYMAEVVRGGLQAMPAGQFEAAKSLGLNYPQTMGLIILPQALKHVIPGIANTFIGLFKDTTLVTIVGMMDLVGILHSASADPEWLGFSTEGYVFSALFYLLFCYGISKYSHRVELKLNTGHSET